jgi:hypothetical protein
MFPFGFSIPQRTLNRVLMNLDIPSYSLVKAIESELFEMKISADEKCQRFINLRAALVETAIKQLLSVIVTEQTANRYGHTGFNYVRFDIGQNGPVKIGDYAVYPDSGGFRYAAFFGEQVDSVFPALKDIVRYNDVEHLVLNMRDYSIKMLELIELCKYYTDTTEQVRRKIQNIRLEEFSVSELMQYFPFAGKLVAEEKMQLNSPSEASMKAIADLGL